MTSKEEEKVTSCLAGCFFMIMVGLASFTICLSIIRVIEKVVKQVNPEPVIEKVEPKKVEPEYTIDEWIDKYNQR